MPEPVPLFHAERWVSQWKALGGIISIGDGLLNPAGKSLGDILKSAKTLTLAEPWNSPRRHQVQHLRAMLELPGAQDRVIEYICRQRSSSGHL
jgi:hypothetical protein